MQHSLHQYYLSAHGLFHIVLSAVNSWSGSPGALKHWEHIQHLLERFGCDALDGLSTISPEFDTDSTYATCWIREEGNIYLYKTVSSRYEVEPPFEFLAGQLVTALCPSFVDYDLDFYRGEPISKCRLFTNEAQCLTKASGIFLRIAAFLYAGLL